MARHIAQLAASGGGRIPTEGQSLYLSREELERVACQVAAELYPRCGYGSALAALSVRADAAKIIREAAEAYIAGR
ncbi:MAG: hypothetical protein RLZZ387_262 [Chloroflexota bacterium]|jgi:hypothetical protein